MRATLHVTLLVGSVFSPDVGFASEQQHPLAVAPFDAETARRHQEQWAKHLNVPRVTTNSIGMKLVLIPAGEFQMGGGKSPDEIVGVFELHDSSSEEHFRNEHPRHRVRITKPFYLQTTELTQGQWESVMGTRPWSGQKYVKEGPNYAATYVSWVDAQEFCRRLSEKEGMTCRLPTEAEWEYACRAGSTTMYHFGDDPSRLEDYAWFKGNAYDAGEKYVHEVGLKNPNAFGLYDMHGNLWEWCQDWYGKDYYPTFGERVLTSSTPRE